MSDSSRPHGLQPTRLLRPWDLPGKSTGVGCHRLLQEKLWAAFKSKSDFSVSKLHCISCHDSNIYNNDNAQCWKDWLSGLLIHYCPACFQTPHCPSLALCVIENYIFQVPLFSGFRVSLLNGQYLQKIGEQENGRVQSIYLCHFFCFLQHIFHESTFSQTIPSLMIPATNGESDQRDSIIVLFLFRWSWFLPLVIPAHPSVPSMLKFGRIFLLLPISGLFYSWLLSVSITYKANFLLYFPSVKSIRVVFMTFAEMWLIHRQYTPLESKSHNDVHTCWSSFLCWKLFPKEITEEKQQQKLYIGVHFSIIYINNTVSEYWKPPKCPILEEWTKKIRVHNTME